MAKTKSKKVIIKSKRTNKHKTEIVSTFNTKSKVGRDTLFADPSKLYGAFVEYKQFCADNPDYSTEWKGRGLVKIPLKRVLHLFGFLLWCDTHLDWWNEFKKSKAYADDPQYPYVMKLIEHEIYLDKFTGASNGKLNAFIIARDLKLREGVDIDMSDSRKAAADLFPDDKDFIDTKKK